jgi:carboxypeptidase family protein/TonB-dependent receptor-like protein
MRGFAVVLALAFSLLVAVSIHAQVTGATLSGTVTDASGGVIAGAQISVRNTATGITKDATADSAGFYTVPNLPAGPYEVKVTAKGFSTTVQSSITLAVGAQQTLNIPMKVGETSQTVEVTEAAPLIDLTSSTLTGQVESQTVLDLPLNGRDWTSLATLHPGVALIEEQLDYSTSGRGNRGFGAELTISGQRTTYNNYRLDGISVNDYANSGPGNVIGAALGVDAIQEFSVLTGGFSAEYGKAAGGVINAITKSGTNAFHGDVYEFLRNSALDSRDYFTRVTNNPRADFKRNQFGGSAGGPIIKDKTFVFGDYEGLRQVKGVVVPSPTVPSLNARLGILAGQPAANNPTGTPCTEPAGSPGHWLSPLASVCVDDATTAIFRMYPTTSLTPNPSDPNKASFVSTPVQRVPENFYTFRIDHKLGANDSLGGTYLYDDTDFKQPDAWANDLLNSHTRRQTVLLQESHTFGPSFVNAARVGYSRTHVINLEPLGAINSAAGDPALGSGPGLNAPQIKISGLSTLPGGVGTASYYFHTFNNYQFYDDVFWTHGNHTFKFGGGVERMQYNFEAFQSQGGLWKFKTLKDLLINNAFHFEQGIPSTITPRELRQSLFAGYVQDDWRFRPNLTLNIGLRYEMATVMKDAQGKISSLLNISDPGPQCGTQYTSPILSSVPGASCASVGPYYSNPTTRNFEPRIGFAWDPFRDGKTSVRGGFGIYDVLPLPAYFLTLQNQAGPFMVFSSLDTSGLAGHFFKDGETLLLNPPNVNGQPVKPGTLAVSTFETHPHRNYVEEWNLNVQRQITPTLSLMVGYVGSHGVHNLTRGDDGNMTLPTQTSAGLLFPCGLKKVGDTVCTPGLVTGAAAPAPSAKINQALGIIRYVYWGTDSAYDALNVSLDKKMSHGLQYQLSYTWGKSLDESSATIAGDAFQQGLNSLYYFAPKSLRGLSDFNVGHTLAINALWAIPTPQSFNGLAKTALGGWQMGGIVKFNTGVPTTPIIAQDPMGLGNAGADQFGIPNLIPGCDPINHNFIGPAFPVYINANCYTPPTAPASFASQCGPFPGAPPLPSTSPVVYCANLLGNAGRNSITGPHLVNVDFSMVKNTAIKRISESFNVQFRAEIFNIFNHSNFLPPNPVTGKGGATVLNTDGSITAGSGVIDALSTQPRDVQIALKVIW